MIQLKKQLGTRRFSHTDPQKWNRFLGFAKARLHRGKNDPDVAYLEIWHPVTPNPQPALAFLRDRREHESIVESRESLATSPKGRCNAMFSMARASWVLRRSGQPDDAEWVRQYMRELFSDEDVAAFSRRAHQDRSVVDKIDIPDTDSSLATLQSSKQERGKSMHAAT